LKIKILIYTGLLCVVTIALLVSGCMGYQVVGPSATPTPTPIATPTAQIVYVTVTPAPAPMANFNANPYFGTAPLVVTFTDESANNPTAWMWNFGDGVTSTQQNPMHAYNNAGSFTVTLTVTNAGGSNTMSKLITVNAAPTAQVVYVTPNPTPTPTAQTVMLTSRTLNIDYTSTTDYFGPASQTLSLETFYTTRGGTFIETISLTSDALMYDHRIDSVSVTTPGFTLESVNPSLPSADISPGSSIVLTLTIRAPNSDYNGPLNIRVSTS
jgi:PKD repeat protein